MKNLRRIFYETFRHGIFLLWRCRLVCRNRISGLNPVTLALPFMTFLPLVHTKSHGPHYTITKYGFFYFSKIYSLQIWIDQFPQKTRNVRETGRVSDPTRIYIFFPIYTLLCFKSSSQKKTGLLLHPKN